MSPNHKTGGLSIAWVVAVLAAIVLMPLSPAWSGTIWVTVSVDGAPSANEEITFREALLIANGSRPVVGDEQKHVSGAVGKGITDTINLNNLGEGDTIALVAPLPPLNDSADEIRANSLTVLDGSGLGGGPDPVFAFDLATDNHTIRGLTVSGFPSTAIRITGSWNTLGGMLIQNSGRDGIEISGSGATGNIITNCAVSNSKGYGIILIGGAHGNTLTSVFAHYNDGTGIIIMGEGTDDNVLIASGIGVKPSLSTPGLFERSGNRRYGVIICSGAKRNRLGNADHPRDFTFVSNNDLGGIVIEDEGTDDNMIHSVWLGFDSNDPGGVGNGSVGNGYGSGIVVRKGAKNTKIGQPGWDPYVVLSGHTGDCIVITGVGSDGTFVQRTFLGGMNPNVWGMKMRNHGHGIVVSDGASNTILGGTESLTQIEADYLGPAPGPRHAIYINGNNPDTPVTNTKVRYFHLGRERFFETEAHVTGDMIHITGNVDTVELGYPGHENTINGAAGYGIAIDGPDVNNVTVHRVVPGDWWLAPSPNDKGGILIANGAQNITLSGPGPDHRSCILSNGGPGIHIDASNDPPRNVRIQNCWIGLVSYEGHGMPEPIEYGPNQGPGIYVQGPPEGSEPVELDLIIGSKDDPNLGNVIVANEGNGIKLENVKGVEIYANKIGTSPDGEVAHGNTENGILVHGCEAIEIGADSPDYAGNLISGNDKAGICFAAESHNVSVHQNLIGSNAAGDDGIPNKGGGIVVEAPGPAVGKGLVIGGPSPLANDSGSMELEKGNIISGNDTAGVKIAVEDAGGEIQAVQLQGNLIGVGLDGETAVPNNGPGVHISGTTVHDIALGSETAPLLRNVISGNKEEGVLIKGQASIVKLYQNRIGSGVDPNKEVPNETHGIWLADGVRENLVQENSIRFNKENGIRVSDKSTERNTFKNNSIHRNEKEGILVLDDAQGGIKPPIIHRLVDPCSPQDRLRGKATVPFGAIEVFIDPLAASDKEGYFGQGKERVLELVADSKGILEIPLTFRQAGTITATITDSSGNTSAFSPFMQGLVIQVVKTKDDYLVANKPTVVRVFADTGLGGTSRGVKGELTMSEGPVIAPRPVQFTMRRLFGFNTRPNDRKQGRNSLNFFIEKPPSGKQTFEMTLLEGTRKRGRFDMGEFEFKSIDSFHFAFARVGAPSRNGTLPLRWPSWQHMIQAAGYFSSVFPFDPTKFVARTHIIPSVRLNIPPHTPQRRFDLYKKVDKLRTEFVLLDGSRPRYAAAVISDQTRFEGPGAGGILFGSTFPDIPRVIGMLDRDPCSPLVHNGPTLIHEIGHTPPFNLGDTYSGGDPNALNPINPDAAKHDARGNYVLEEHQAFAPLLNMNVFGLRGPVWGDAGGRIYDFMGNTAPAWADPCTYEVLFKAMTPTRAAMLLTFDLAMLIVRGEVTTSDVVTLLPIRHRSGNPDDVLSTKGTVYTVELQDASGVVLDSRTFGLTFEEHITMLDPNTGETSRIHEVTDESAFIVVLRDDPAATRVVVKKGDVVLKIVEKSPSSPVVSLTGPHGPGELQTGDVEVSWTGFDDDPGDTERLVFDVLYTPDDGQTILPLLVDLASTNSVNIDTALLPAGESPRFIVRANDGWNESEDMSDPPLTIQDRMPAIELVQPASDDFLTDANPVALLTAAYDAEDGILSGEAIAWTVDDDPNELLATGANPVVLLPGGVHTLRATVTDSEGNIAYDEVVLEIETSCTVLLEDFAVLASQWFSTTQPAADLDGSGKVDIGELAALAEAWLGPCPYDWPFKP